MESNLVEDSNHIGTRVRIVTYFQIKSNTHEYLAYIKEQKKKEINLEIYIGRVSIINGQYLVFKCETETESQEVLPIFKNIFSKEKNEQIQFLDYKQIAKLNIVSSNCLSEKMTDYPDFFQISLPKEPIVEQKSEKKHNSFFSFFIILIVLCIGAYYGGNYLSQLGGKEPDDIINVTNTEKTMICKISNINEDMMETEERTFTYENNKIKKENIRNFFQYNIDDIYKEAKSKITEEEKMEGISIAYQYQDEKLSYTKTEIRLYDKIQNKLETDFESIKEAQKYYEDLKYECKKSE